MAMSSIIAPSCVGKFFSSDTDELRERVRHYLGNVADSDRALPTPRLPKAIIVPHAGYDYSGPIAAAGYATLAGHTGTYHRVVLVGTSHVRQTSGLLATTANAFVTPLGKVAVDQDAVRQVSRLPQVSVDNDAHATDHSLAVQLPMMQATLDEFRVVPFLVGKCDAVDVAELLELLWGGNETLIIVSSDLSHYLSYDEARRRDQRTAEAIVRLDFAAIGRDDACGHRAIAGLLLVARRHNLQARQIDLRNSGDIASDRDRVVGYGAFVFEPALP